MYGNPVCRTGDGQFRPAVGSTGRPATPLGEAKAVQTSAFSLTKRSFASLFYTFQKIFCIFLLYIQKYALFLRR
jgi:hypothetical protein